MRARSALLLAVPIAIALAIGTCKPNGGRAPSGYKVVVLGLDGANTAVISPLVSQGKMPNFAKYLAKAAGGHLDSPVAEGWISASLWTTLVTGFPPPEHGITGFTMPLPNDPTKQVASASGHRRRPALWNILSDAGVKSGIVGLWATWPAEKIDGAIVSDHVTYSRLRLSKTFKTQDGDEIPFSYDTRSRNVSPASLLYDVEKHVLLPADIDAPTLRRFADFSDAEIGELKRDVKFGSFNVGTEPLPELKVSIQSDRSYAAIGQLVRERVDPSLLWVYLEGIDVMEHAFWSHRAGLDLVREPERTRFKDVIDRYCAFTDELIAPYLALADDETIVIVVSDHGYASVPREDTDEWKKRPHWHDNNAIFFAAGGPIRPGAQLNGSGKLEDVTPTILALLGLRVGADMPGRVLEEILTPEFARQHPIRRGESYGKRALVPADIQESGAGSDLIDRMRGVPGYISDPNATPPASRPAHAPKQDAGK